MKKKQLIAPEEVYDFLKVIWSDYETESNYENLSIMVYTLADPDCVRWLSENIEFGDEKQLSLLNKNIAGNMEMNYQSGWKVQNIDYC